MKNTIATAILFSPARGATLRYATLRTGRNVETNAPSILALATLGNLTSLTLEFAAVAANYTKL